MRTLVLFLILTSPLAAQGPGSGAFLTRLGNDTIAVERYQRHADRVEGEIVAFAPATRIIRYVLHLTRAGTVHAADVRTWTGAGAPGTAPAVTTRLERDDSVVTTITRRPDRTDTVRTVVRPTTVPWISPSMVGYEQMVLQALRQGGDSVRVDQYTPGSRGPTANAVVRLGPGEVAIAYFGSPNQIRIGPDGGILAFDGSRTTNKIRAERVSGDVDIMALAAAGVARERAGAATGALSTRDTARATIGAAHLAVDYGRPAARGRQILGNVVPFGEVWRTGANTATHLTTTRDLQVGGTIIPSGTYTLWTLPTPEGTHLIINRQTGQWGTQYDPAQDLARVPVQASRAPTPVERFTIQIEPGAGGGTLVLSWHTFVWRVPFTVR